MESKTSGVSWVVLVMAACSLFSMVGTLEIDGIINRELYQYGLQFSYAWATPYWTTAGFVFAMGWLNIITALIIHVRILYLKRKALREIPKDTDKIILPVVAAETPKEKPIEKPKEQPKEEKTRPGEAEEKPKEVQTVTIDTNLQKEEEKPVEVEEAPAKVITLEAERAEENQNQESQSPQESENQQAREAPKEGGETPLPQSAEP
jgi:hypothetical protein